ncbi:DoxX [uncultured archaeon]|nr:DoxX [uncultured archaeon]
MSDKKMNYADLSLRLGIGILFIIEGFYKLFVFTPAGFAHSLTWLGPLALVAGWGVSLLEFIGGIAIILNKFVKWFTLLLALEMVVIIITTVIPGIPKMGYGGLGFHMAFLGGLVSLTLSRWNSKDVTA